MIRPLTIATFLMACGSGLYLYQSKHQAQVLDRTIEKTVHDTAALREQSRTLATEWTMLNDPEALRRFADSYLRLKPIDPKQFTSLADLDTRLPPVEVPSSPPSEGMDDDAPSAISEAAPRAPEPAEVATSVVARDPAPAARRPAVAAVAASVRLPEHKVVTSKPATTEAVTYLRPMTSADARPVDQRSLDQHPSPDQHSGSEQRLADSRSADTHAPRPADAHVADKRAAEAEAQAYEARVAALRAQLASPAHPTVLASAPRPGGQPADHQAAAPASAGSPFTGSLLGMARGLPAPVPRPTPVNATPWSNTN